MSKKVLIILDDREYTSGDISRIVGRRLFGDIFATRKSQSGRIKESLPIWAEDLYFHIRNNEDITRLRSAIESSPENTALFIVSASAGISDIGNLTQIIERLPYAEEDFTSSLYRPLLIFFHNAHF